jgi:hypothetical protein
VAQLALRLGRHQPLPPLTVDGAPCPPADVLQRVREAIVQRGEDEELLYRS